jgi:hypothetical protein
MAPRRVHPSRFSCVRAHIRPGDIREGHLQRTETERIVELWGYGLGRSRRLARWWVFYSRKQHEIDFSLQPVKYFSPTTHLCIIRVARGEAAHTTWAALVLLDRIGNNDEYKVVPYVIHVSGALPATI